MHSEKTLHDKFAKLAECCRRCKQEQDTMREVSQSMEAESMSRAPLPMVPGVLPVVPTKR